MKKITTLILLIAIFVLYGCNLPWEKTTFAAIQITSVPKATVFVDNKEKGKTPYYDEKIIPGEHNIKLVSDSSIFSTWEGKVKFSPLIMTVINRILAPTDILSSGDTITMEELNDNKNSELAVISSPDGAKVVIDKSDAGLTPFAQKNVVVAEHEVVISLPGYSERLIKVKNKLGYRLIINAQLAQILSNDNIIVEASGSATISGQSIIGNDTVITDQVPRPRVKILETPTGWLRIRSGPNISSGEVAKANPGELYSYLDEQAGWVKIRIDKDKEGWVSVQYVEKQL